MTQQRESLYVGRDTIGWLTWWTIRKGSYNVAPLRRAAQDAGLDDYVVSRIRGRDEIAAFLAAVRTGSAGVPIPSPAGEAWRLITREADTQGSTAEGRTIRALVLQKTNPNSGEIEDVVSAHTLAILTADTRRGRISVNWANPNDINEYVERKVQEMQVKMEQNIGTIDDGRIRTIVIGWLRERHRISVRGTGGVYFVPAPIDMDEKKERQDEMVSMRDWMATIGSPFSIVAFNERGALSLNDFVQDAVGEIEDELKDISEKLAGWAQNTRMNAGSLMFSTNTQVSRMKNIRDKIKALKESLGEAVGTVDEMYHMLHRQATGMQEKASAEVDEAQKAKTAKKAEKAKSKEKGKDKKAGTAKERSAKQTV